MAHRSESESHQGSKSRHYRGHHSTHAVREAILHPIDHAVDAVVRHLPVVGERLVKPTAEEVTHELIETLRGAGLTALLPGTEQISDAVGHVIGSGKDVRDIWERSRAARLGERRGRSEEFDYFKIHERAEKHVAINTPELLAEAVAAVHPRRSEAQRDQEVENIQSGRTRLRGKVEREVEGRIEGNEGLTQQLAEEIKKEAQRVLDAKKEETEARIAGSAVAQAIESGMTIRDIAEAAIATGVAGAGTFLLTKAPVIGPFLLAHPGVAVAIVSTVGTVAFATALTDIITGRVNGAQQITALAGEYEYIKTQVDHVMEDPLNEDGYFVRSGRKSKQKAKAPVVAS